MTRLKWRLFRVKKCLNVQLCFLKRRLVAPSFPKTSDGKILLHIGCGELSSPEFINVDARPFPHVHIVTDDITDLSIFGNETVDLIYMCHILEHVKRNDLKKVLWEMKRALKNGGLLRLSVPDFDRIIDIYNASAKNISSIEHPLMGSQTHKYDFHYSIFNCQQLSVLLKEIGFREIREWDPYNCQYHDFDDFASKKIIIGRKEHIFSLNLEAVK